MGILGRLFGGNKRNEKLAAWARGVQISGAQQTAMWELWQAAQREEVPDTDPLAKLTESDRSYVKQICSADFRPKEFGSADTLRLASYRHFKGRNSGDSIHNLLTSSRGNSGDAGIPGTVYIIY